MHLEIITPEEKVFDGEVESVTFPGTDGSFQILNGHAALISSLKQGVVEYKGKEIDEEIKITGGVVEVLNNIVIVLAEGLATEE